MVRFIHTADWQLGLKLAYIPEERRADAQQERFAVVERIAALAEEHDVDAVLVAGDVFDDNAVGRRLIQKARDALARFADIPVLLLPGNHDPATEESALLRLHAGDHVHVMAEPRPFAELDGVVVYPCPTLSRDQQGDPTSWVPARGDDGSDDLVRVALAHGSIIDFSEDSESPELINATRLLDHGIDYVALGDWHGMLCQGSRIWYSGAPEATRFKEKRPGFVLVVEIDGPGDEPRVTPVEVARTRWIRQERTLDHSEDLDALIAWFAALPERSKTLVEVRLDGALSYDDRNRLDELLEHSSQDLLWLRVRRNEVGVAPTSEDLERLNAPGFVGTAAAGLRESMESDDEQVARQAQEALRLLHRLIGEVGS